MTDLEKIQKAKDKINELMRKQAEREGQQKQILKELFETYGCSGLCEAEQKLKELDKELQTKEEEKEKLMGELDKFLEKVGT